eukprot:5176854-Pleurochrysis_carterae.AAC.1
MQHAGSVLFDRRSRINHLLRVCRRSFTQMRRIRGEAVGTRGRPRKTCNVDDLEGRVGEDDDPYKYEPEPANGTSSQPSPGKASARPSRGRPVVLLAHQMILAALVAAALAKGL